MYMIARILLQKLNFPEYIFETLSSSISDPGRGGVRGDVIPHVSAASRRSGGMPAHPENICILRYMRWILMQSEG